MANQTATLAFLKSKAALGGSIEPQVIETHISSVVLGDEIAYKLKRAVVLPYLDFSSPERRLAACERELALNRRTAPNIYRAVHRITADGELAFDGKGPLVDAVVEMRRFDQALLFDRLATDGKLTQALMEELAIAIARFHRGAVPKRGTGAAASIRAIIDGNEQALAQVPIFREGSVRDVGEACRHEVSRLSGLLDSRAREGKVRLCHGDLHLRNICLIDGSPTLFDCLEFSEDLATIDILYDLAFLLADLWHRDLAALGNFTLNRYLDHADEAEGLPLMPLFMALRATVRAHVTALEAAAKKRPDLAEQARGYLDLALSLLRPRDPVLIAIGGLSGSGKSTVAAAIADRVGPAPGARVLSSDRFRKAMFGVRAQDRLPAEAYQSEASSSVYDGLLKEARRVLRAGHAVILDASFQHMEERENTQLLAGELGVPFTGIWLKAPEDVLLSRVRDRRNDPSDADVEVVRQQLAQRSVTPKWRALDTGGNLPKLVSEVLRACGQRDAAAD